MMGRRNAFTLVELLVAVAIIGLLVAILLPGLRKARIQTKRTVCATNLKQIGVGLQSYLMESRDRLPFASFLPSTGPFPIDGDEAIYIADVLLPHVGNEPRVFHCPNDETGVDRPAPNHGLSYYESERSSYEYRIQIGGQKIEQVVTRMKRFGGRTVTDNTIWIMRDYDNFHGEAGQPGARRYLYIDGHVEDFEN